MHSFQPTGNTVIVNDISSISEVDIYLNAGLNNKKKLISKLLSSAYSHCNNA